MGLGWGLDAVKPHSSAPLDKCVHVFLLMGGEVHLLLCFVLHPSFLNSVNNCLPKAPKFQILRLMKNCFLLYETAKLWILY